MIRAFLAALCACAIFAVNATAQDGRALEERIPVFVKVVGIGADCIYLCGPHTRKHSFQYLQPYDGRGKAFSTAELCTRVKVGSVVVLAEQERPVDPAYLATLNKDTIVLTRVARVLSKEEQAGGGWTLDCDKMKLTDRPVSGYVLGVNFKLDKVELEPLMLSLWSGHDKVGIWLNIPPGETLAGKSYRFRCRTHEPDQSSVISIGDASPPPSVSISTQSPPPFKVQTHAITESTFCIGYAMRLEFGAEKDGSVPGKVYLCVNDYRKSWIAGSFSVKVR